MIYNFLAFAISFVAMFAHAQTQVLTLDQAVTEGLHQSPDIQRTRSELDEHRAERDETFAKNFIPKVSLSAYHYVDKKYTLTDIQFGPQLLSFPGFYPTNGASFDVVIPLFDGFSGWEALSAANFDVSSEELNLRDHEFRLRQNIRLTFFSALAAANLKAVAEQNVKTLEDHLKQVSIQRRGGVATSYDTLRVEVQLNEARADAIDAQDNAVVTRQKLAQVLGLENDDRPLQGTLPVPEAERVKNMSFNRDLRGRADIESLNERSRSAEKSHNADRGWFLPMIYVGGQYMFYETQIFENTVQDTGHYANAYNMGVFLKWNLFDGGAALQHSRASAARAAQADQSARQAQIQAPYDFNYWRRRYLSNTDHYLSKSFDIKRSQESVRLAKQEQRAGTRTSTETLDAELDLYRSQAGAINAQLAAAEAQIQLELALGREI